MADISNLSVWTSTDGERWVVATGTAPYFCFEADSEEEALRIAGRALAFYCEAAASKQEGRKTAATPSGTGLL